MRFLAWLDSVASGLVPVLYLLGLMAGIVAYFTGLAPDLGVSVGVALGVAECLHSWIQQRRVRALWGEYQRAQRAQDRAPRASASRASAGSASGKATPGGPAPDPLHILSQLRANLALLGALVLFDCFTATAFVAESWRPAPGFLPAWLQIGIRGCVIPLFFLLSGFLIPLSLDAGELMARASEGILQRTVRASMRQYRRRIRHALKHGADLSPLARELMRDSGEYDGERRLGIIADNLAAAEAYAAQTRPAQEHGTLWHIFHPWARQEAPAPGVALASLDRPSGAVPGMGYPVSALAYGIRPQMTAYPSAPSVSSGYPSGHPSTYPPFWASVPGASWAPGASAEGDTGEDIRQDRRQEHGEEGPEGPDDDTPPSGPSGGRKRSRGRGTGHGSSAAPSIVRMSDPGTSSRRSDSGRSRADAEALWQRDIDFARMILASTGGQISSRELARRLSVERVSVCHPSRASAIRKAIEGKAQEATGEDIRQDRRQEHGEEGRAYASNE